MQEKSLKVLEFYKIRDMLVERAASSLGKARCAALVPVSDIREIERMQAETEEASTLVARTGVQPISAFDDVQAQVARAKVGGILSPKDLLLCARLMQTARSVRRTLVGEKDEAEETETPHLVGLARALYPMRRLEEEIFAAILSEEEIADSASPGLASVRRKIRSANERIRDKLNGYLHSSSMARYLQDAIITMRQGRYVLPVRAEYRSQVPGIVHDQSSSGATLFIEPMAIVEINNDLRGLMGEERAEIEKILQRFSEEISQEAGALLENQRILAELDFIFAKGALARQMRAVQPKINEAGYIDIKRGRHPLIDPEAVVPSDLWIGKDFTTLVVTGPNTGGKTVTLKTVGLFTLMMQAGLQVPAMLGTELAVFDDVFADIGDEQSIEQSLSTFSSHMVNIVRIQMCIRDRPEMVRHFMEIRGVGIINVKNMYGVGAVINSKSIDMVIHLELWDNNKEYDRLGLNEDFTAVLGVKLPKLTLPVRPGRNLAIVIEVAASNHRLKKMGYNGAQELNDRLSAKIQNG